MWKLVPNSREIHGECRWLQHCSRCPHGWGGEGLGCGQGAAFSLAPKEALFCPECYKTSKEISSSAALFRVFSPVRQSRKTNFLPHAFLQ